MPENKAAVEFVPREDVWFWLPTIQYLIEMPFRICAADALLYGGKERIYDHVYELLYATWGTFAPHEKIDQYMLYIEQKTGRLRFVRYTVRDKSPPAASFVDYPEYRALQGGLLPAAFRKVISPQNPRVKNGVFIRAHTSLPADKKRLLPRPEQKTYKHKRGGS